MTNLSVSIGRIVEFFPGTNSNAIALPNTMESAPAIVTQVFDEHVNLTLFTANPNGEPTMQAWSIKNKENANEGDPFWDWPARI